MQSVVFTTKYVRLSPKKAEVLARQIQKMSPKHALETLVLTREKQATLFLKILEAAIANAVTNRKLNEDALVFESIQVTKGPAFKRWTAVARGMAHPIKKRTSHIKVVLKEKVSQETKKPVVQNQKQEEVKNVKKEEVKK